MREESYGKAFFIASFAHLLLGLLLVMQPDSQRPVLNSTVNQARETLSLEEATQPKQVEIVKAVSIDSQEVMQTLSRLKQERAEQLKAEETRQQALVREAELARKARLQEQQRLASLKEETEKLAIARKKQLAEEQQRIKQLSLQKELETKRLEELKIKQQQLQKKQQEATEKLMLLHKKQAEEKERAEREENARQAALEAAKKAQIAGEVNRYKALIINAISRQWILPENADKTSSSQFRIRLAPSGAVQEVTLIRSSGDAVLDRSAQTAIYKASPLPVPADPVIFDLFRDISLTVRPENIRG